MRACAQTPPPAAAPLTPQSSIQAVLGQGAPQGLHKCHFQSIDMPTRYRKQPHHHTVPWEGVSTGTAADSTREHRTVGAPQPPEEQADPRQRLWHSMNGARSWPQKDFHKAPLEKEPWKRSHERLAVAGRGAGGPRAAPTFLVQLQDGWGWCGHLHGQAVGTTEGVAVTHDERPRLLVL